MIRRLPTRVKCPLISFLLLPLLAGCTPDFYRHDADLQVDKLLEDRKQTTLGYKPKTDVKSEDVTPPTKKSYATIPVTPIPPPQPPPMEPAHFELGYQRLGPPGEATSPISDQPTSTPGFQTADLQRESTERLKLGPPAAGPQAVIQLDLFRSINYGVHHGRDYQSRMEDMYISTLDVLLQRHAFEPQPFATQTIEYSRGLPDSSGKYDSALNATNTVGVRQRLPLGGVVTARALVDFTDALNQNTADGESGQLALTG